MSILISLFPKIFDSNLPISTQCTLQVLQQRNQNIPYQLERRPSKTKMYGELTRFEAEVVTVHSNGIPLEGSRKTTKTSLRIADTLRYKL
jgi:hypothetical protein